MPDDLDLDALKVLTDTATPGPELPDYHPGTPEERATYWRGRAEAAWRREDEAGMALIRLRGELKRARPVLDAAKVRAQVLRDLREFGSGSDGWYDRDRLSDAAILAAVDALEAPVPP